MQWLYLGKFTPHSTRLSRLSLNNATLMPRGVHAVVYPIPKVRRGDSVLCVEHPYMATGKVVSVTCSSVTDSEPCDTSKTQEIVVQFEEVVILTQPPSS